MEIDLVEFKKIIDRLFHHIIVTRDTKSCEINASNYWNIPSPDVYSGDKDPTNLDIGSLEDDWEFLSRLLDENNQPVAYQLTEVAPLLRYIGETLGEKLAKYGG
jgi:hypothetical protein